MAFVLLRHGQSKANVAGVIVSAPANGVLEKYALSDKGKAEAAQVRPELQRHVCAIISVNVPRFAVRSSQRAPPALTLCYPMRTRQAAENIVAKYGKKLTVVASDFSRALETVRINTTAWHCKIL